MTSPANGTEDGADDNIHYRESLTVWGPRISAQVRIATMHLHHYEDAPRSTEHGHPWVLETLDMVLLRDLLNAATARGELPRPEGGAAEDAYSIGHRPSFVNQIREAYAQGKADARRDERLAVDFVNGILPSTDQFVADVEHVQAQTKQSVCQWPSCGESFTPEYVGQMFCPSCGDSV